MAKAVANGSPAPAATDGPLNTQAGPSLFALADTLGGNAHLLSLGSEEISRVALEAAKSIFDYGISLEPISHPHLHPFIASVTSEPPITLRPSTLAKSGKHKAPSPPPPRAPDEILPYTPLSELTIDGLDAEQVWAQLELRAEGVVKVIGEIGEGGPETDDEDRVGAGYDYDDSDNDSDSDSEGESGEDEEEMTVEEWERMMAERSDSDDDLGSGDEEDSDDADEDDDEDENEDEEEGDSDDSDNRVIFKNGAMASSDGEEDEEEEEDEDEDDDEDEADGSDLDMSGSDIDPDLIDADESDEDEHEEDEEEDDLDTAGPSKSTSKPKKGKRSHPTLDDEFFSIDDFNRLTEEAEAGHLGSGRLGGDDDDDEDEELGDIGDLMLKGADEDEPLMYGDFFAPPRQTPEERAKAMRDMEKSGKSKPKKGKKEEKKGKKDKKGKGKGKASVEDEDDLDMDGMDEEDEEEEGEEGGRDVMSRVKGDLFDDDDEQEEQVLSTHEKRQLALREQIAELEGQAIGPKDWVLMGEASSRARPENSLLEQDLDFEHAGKVVPTITEESVATLEELIKRRILDNEFNSTVRVRAYEPTPFLPSRFFELQDTQSSKSLAQIYEDEYQTAASGSKAVDARDEKLKKEHAEIDALWSDICYKLDALSSLNFVPKQPKAQIATIDNLPTTSMESALPTTSSTTTLLAPEEQFAPPQASTLMARTEMTPEEKQKARQKGRKAKQAMRKGLEEMAELHGRKKKQSVKEQKEEAMKSLVKSGKGVTVVGKGSKEAEKAQGRKRAAGDGERENAKRLKL